VVSLESVGTVVMMLDRAVAARVALDPVGKVIGVGGELIDSVSAAVAVLYASSCVAVSVRNSCVSYIRGVFLHVGTHDPSSA